MGKVKLGDIAVLINGDRGKNYPSQKEIITSGGIPFVNAGHLNGRAIEFEAMNYITPEKYEKLNSGKFQQNDILYCRRGSLGKKALINDNIYGAIASSLVIIRPNLEKVRPQYLMLALETPLIKEQLFKFNNGSSQPNLSAKSVKEYKLELPDLFIQDSIISKLEKVRNLIEDEKQEKLLLDNLIQARFVEMFGDPITNSKLLPIEKIEERYFLKAGITTKAEDIHDYLKDKYEIPCYGGNGIRGYVENLSYEGCYPIIGRQGALCGNVQYATGKFHATEHAVLVSTLKNDNTMWVYYMLKLMDLYRYHTGAAQPGLAVKKLNTIDVIVADINLQNQFAAFVHQINKSKFVIHKFLYCTTHNTKSIIKPRPNTKESGKIRGRETTCRRILTF